jgi:hypothetical protein
MTTKLENPKAKIEQGYDIVAKKYLAWYVARFAIELRRDG